MADNPSLYRAMRHLNKGGLHRALGVPEGQDIPKERIEKAKGSKNPHVAHMAHFAGVMGNFKKKVASPSSYDEGGKVQKGGQAQVHKGEVVVPKPHAGPKTTREHKALDDARQSLQDWKKNNYDSNMFEGNRDMHDTRTNFI